VSNEQILTTNVFLKIQAQLDWRLIGVFIVVVVYNFVRIHKTLRTTPAMAAKVTSRLWEIGDIVNVLEAREAQAQ